MKKLFLGLLVLAVFLSCSFLTGCGKNKGADGVVTLEFAQWWEPELPEGSLRALMDQFEAENPGIKVELLSGPYASTKEQIVAGAATQTMSDVVGLDGAWVNDFVKQGAITDLSSLMNEAAYDSSQLSAQIKVDGGTYMIPVVNYIYPLYVNMDLLNKAGIEEIPSTRSEFKKAAAAITDADNNVYGWILPLSLEAPNGIQNDVMSWVWASGESMMKDGKPDLVKDGITDALAYIKGMYDDGIVSPGSFSMKEQDKVEEFTNGRVGMMVSSLAHINILRDRNPDLNFKLSSIPAKDGYDGKRGIPFASWGIGIAENSEHKAESWKLVEFLMSTEVNSKLATVANAFPGNVNSKPDMSKSDPLFADAFEMYQKNFPENEFVGLPVAEDLMRSFDEELQKTLSGDQSIDELVTKAQEKWEKEF